MSRKRIPLNQNGCTANFRIGVPFGQNLHYPVQEGYGNIYPEAAFLRESDSIAYEAQTAGDDYVENSDPGDGDYSGNPYYWYDGEGNVMYFDGVEDFYIGPDNVFYIDEEGNLCEY